MIKFGGKVAHEHVSTLLDSCEDRYMDYVFSVRAAWVMKKSSAPRSWLQAGICKPSPVGFLLRKRHQQTRDRFLNRCKHLKYCSPTTPCITEQFDKADQSLVETVLTNHHNVLYRLLPLNKTYQYTLRPQYHSLTLSCKSSFYDNSNFISRMHFSEAYWLNRLKSNALSLFIKRTWWLLTMMMMIMTMMIPLDFVSCGPQIR